MNKILLPVLLVLSAQAAAQEWDPGSVLGQTPTEAITVLGPPREVLAQRVVEETWQPVFYYDKFLYLFWTRNRVWQVRLDRRYTEGFQGLTMGLGKAEVLNRLGPALQDTENELIYSLPYKSFPRRLRLVFTQGALTDAFFYRSDF